MISTFTLSVIILIIVVSIRLISLIFPIIVSHLIILLRLVAVIIWFLHFFYWGLCRRGGWGWRRRRRRWRGWCRKWRNRPGTPTPRILGVRTIDERTSECRTCNKTVTNVLPCDIRLFKAFD